MDDFYRGYRVRVMHHTQDEYVATAQYCDSNEAAEGGFTHAFLFPAEVYPDKATVMMYLRAYVDGMAPKSVPQRELKDPQPMRQPGS
ncbi:hypothetical protein DEDE109153_15435 [Deinococcus deserti]|uniref:Uncharacterized protein n=1 Tax=Deinococcus deserti (strain DSM 17065 / CIP 109153 / LMG 22923 / VCD115) TaxID=546414 RepID=X5H5N3_DEIDV|nr:hypothetical protein Deide_1p00835 [Deinococcus deserti VCD115]